MPLLPSQDPRLNTALPTDNTNVGNVSNNNNISNTNDGNVTDTTDVIDSTYSTKVVIDTSEPYDPTEDGEPQSVERKVTVISPLAPIGTAPIVSPPPVRTITPYDYEAPKPTDHDFPKTPPGQIPLPALKLETPLPLNVLTEKTQGRVLGWDNETVKVVNHQTGIFQQLPTVCAGTLGCPRGQICPVVNRDDFIGRSCPLEVREVFKHFSGYVLDLDVDPKSYVELQMITDLVRHQLTLWRCDMNLRVESDVIEEVGVVAQKDGKVYNRTIINKHRELQSLTQNKMMLIYKELIATRDAKQNRTRNSNPDANISLLMARLSEFTTKQE